MPSLDLVIIGWVYEGAGTGTCGLALREGTNKGETDPELGLDWVIGGEGRDRGVDWGVEVDSGNDGERELDYVPNWDVGKEHDWEAEIKVGIGICEVGGEVGLVGKDQKG